MPLKLYYTKASAPCRATLLTIYALDLEVELILLDLQTQEHLTTDFIKLNPFHTLPTLEDGSFTIWDSHAINVYLVSKYAANHDLYPEDIPTQAIINQRLHFDSGVLEARFKAIVNSIMKEGAKIVTKDKSDRLIQGFTLLETVLENTKYVAGNTLTIADFSIVTTVNNAKILVPIASNRFPKILDWVERMEQLPYYRKANEEGSQLFVQLMRSKNVIK